MKEQLLTLALTVLGFNSAYGFEGTHWGYGGEAGPDHWAKLDASYLTCSQGKNQSPVNLTKFVDAELAPIEFDYRQPANEIINNGHTVQTNFGVGSGITLGDHRYELKQVHFHTPSENRINGTSFPLAAHLVHMDTEGNLAVVAVLFKEGKDNATVGHLWEKMPMQAHQHSTVTKGITAAELLPEGREYYRFNGSLTTPPCTEGVVWLVMKDALAVSKAQVEKFAKAVKHANNRPVQSLNARMVLK